MAPVNERAELLVVAGYLRYSIAPLGTTEPTEPLIPSDGITPEVTNLANDFVDVGYTEPDSTVRRVTREIEGIMAHQSDAPIRNIEQSRLSQITIALRNYGRLAYQLAQGGGTFTSTPGGNTRFDQLPFGQVEEHIGVLDVIDGAKSLRIVFRRAAVSSGMEANLPKTNVSDLAITIDALQPDGGLNPTYELAHGLWESA